MLTHGEGGGGSGLAVGDGGELSRGGGRQGELLDGEEALRVAGRGPRLGGFRGGEADGGEEGGAARTSVEEGEGVEARGAADGVVEDGFRQVKEEGPGLGALGEGLEEGGDVGHAPFHDALAGRVVGDAADEGDVVGVGPGGDVDGVEVSGVVRAKDHGVAKTPGPALESRNGRLSAGAQAWVEDEEARGGIEEDEDVLEGLAVGARLALEGAEVVHVEGVQREGGQGGDEGATRCGVARGGSVGAGRACELAHRGGGGPAAGVGPPVMPGDARPCELGADGAAAAPARGDVGEFKDLLLEGGGGAGYPDRAAEGDDGDALMDDGAEGGGGPEGGLVSGSLLLRRADAREEGRDVQVTRDDGRRTGRRWGR